MTSFKDNPRTNPVTFLLIDVSSTRLTVVWSNSVWICYKRSSLTARIGKRSLVELAFGPWGKTFEIGNCPSTNELFLFILTSFMDEPCFKFYLFVPPIGPPGGERVLFFRTPSRSACDSRRFIRFVRFSFDKSLGGRSASSDVRGISSSWKHWNIKCFIKAL